MPLILDISKKQHLSVSLHATGAAVQSYEIFETDFQTIRQTSYQILDLIERNSNVHDVSLKAIPELKKNGQLLFDYVIPKAIKEQLRTTKAEDLTVLVDETLVFIPWELLFDGNEFFCRRFNLGRRVKTTQSVKKDSGRPRRNSLMMQVIADPQGNLIQARKEAIAIRDRFAASADILVTTKTKNVYKQYIQKNIRDYDIVHYAGHADYDVNDPQNSGWLLRDGKLNCHDFNKLGESGYFPQLIFMNACQSVLSISKSDDKNYEQGLFGLANAFLMSGGRFVIGALTKISDEAALEMAKSFYGHLIEKKSVGYALRMAREGLIEKRGEDDLAWAAYVLYGDPSGNVFNSPTHELTKTETQIISSDQRKLRRRWLWVLLVLVMVGLLWLFIPHFLSWWHKELGKKSLSLRKYEQASVHYKQALRYQSDDYQAALGVYHVYTESYQYRDAVKTLENVLSRKPTNSLDGRMFILNFTLGQGYYALKDYSAAYKTFLKIVDYSGQSLVERLTLYEYLANSASLTQLYEESDGWYTKAIQLAHENGDNVRRLDLMLAQAINVQLAHTGGIHNQVLMMAKAQDLCEKVLNETEGKDSWNLKARANACLGKIYYLKEDWEQASAFYQKSLDEWKNFKIEKMSIPQMLELAQMHVDLAELLVNPYLKFNESLTHLKMCEEWIQVIDNFARKIKPNAQNALLIDTHKESIKILLRQFERILAYLNQKGYQNSQFYRQAAQTYDQLHDLIYPVAVSE